MCDAHCACVYFTITYKHTQTYKWIYINIYIQPHILNGSICHILYTHIIHSKYYTLYIVHCVSYTEQCIMFRVYCTLYNIHCHRTRLYLVGWRYNELATINPLLMMCPGSWCSGEHCTMYIVHCTVYSIHGTLYAVHCILYSVQCALRMYIVYIQYNKYTIVYNVRYILYTI